MEKKVVYELSFYFEPWQDFVPVGIFSTKEKAFEYAIAHAHEHMALEPWELADLKAQYNVEFKVLVEEVDFLG